MYRVGGVHNAWEVHVHSRIVSQNETSIDVGPLRGRDPTPADRPCRPKPPSGPRIERQPQGNRYLLTDRGRRVAVLFTKTYGRVLAPGPAAFDPGLPDDLARRSPLATAWRTLNRELEHHINHGLTAA